MYYEVLVGSRRFHGDGPLTYSSYAALEPGTVVLVPLARHKAHGVVIRAVQKPSYSTRPIEHAWEFAKVPDKHLRLLEWMHSYYPGPLGQLTELFIPSALVASAKLPRQLNARMAPSTLPPLTEEQVEVLKQLKQHNDSSVLLHGVTGSGKTRVYIERAKETVAAGRSVLVLTPEIGLTLPLVEQFKTHCQANVISVHSDLSPVKRREAWLSVANSMQPIIIVGPRSALFMPISDIGLIVVDEAHDGAYKQDQSPHYLASRVAAKLRELHNAQLILGSATPSITDYYGFSSRELPIISLSTRAIADSTKKHVAIIDSKVRNNFSRSGVLSDRLLDAMTTAKSKNEQVLLFLNKRGSARLVLCQACGWQATCQRCDIALTFHADTHNLRCHSCDNVQAVPISCPECANPDILFTSVGTKALELEVKKLFPNAHVRRFDRDTAKPENLSALSRKLHEGSVDIIIGTQTITKGFDLPNLSVVGVVQADSSLAIPDFSASERTFQLLAQISGRIGRGHRDSTLVIQTFNPDNQLLRDAIDESYTSFYRSEVGERKKYGFPPFAHMMVIRASRASRISAITACNTLKEELESSYTNIKIDGPAPRFIEKQRGKYTWQLLIRSAKRSNLTAIANNLGSRFTFDIDPTDLL